MCVYEISLYDIGPFLKAFSVYVIRIRFPVTVGAEPRVLSTRVLVLFSRGLVRVRVNELLPTV